jgi:diguanylate cyclase
VTADRRAWGAAGRATPRLILRFTVVTALGLVIASVAIFGIVRGFVTAQAQRAIEQNTGFMAQTVLADRLRPGDFELPVGAARRSELDRLFRSKVLVGDIEQASLVTLDGHVSYSTDPALVGRGLEWSASPLGSRGRIRTRVEEVRAGTDKATSVLRQSVPIAFAGSSVGQLVVTRDYGPIAHSVRSTFIRIALVLEGLLLALFASLFPVLRRATRQMDSHLEEFEHQALHDTLTGLPNRALFHDRIELALAEARRSAGRAAVLLLDLDRFKEINDTLGHASGDALLVELSLRLGGAMRETDTIARLGGDEFGVVMRVGGPEDVREAAARIHQVLEQPFEIGGLRLEIGTSIGGVLFPDDALDPDTLVRYADVAMYTAKRNRSGTELYDPEADCTSRDTLSLASELRQALDDGAIVVHYQPKVEVATGRIVGAEALARWIHPERGVVLPESFLPLIEKAGLMSLLTTRVVELAAAQAAEWRSQGIELDTAVNVDVGALLDPDFPARIAEILERERLPADRLTLEITETSIMADPVLAGRVADRLAAIGVRLSIDDFGTGYSSLGHLTALPLTELKIDGSFVKRMSESATDMAIVRTIVDLGASLDLAVVAEGIESSDTYALVHRLGCRLAQGFRFGGPVPSTELTAALLRGAVESGSPPTLVPASL